MSTECCEQCGYWHDIIKSPCVKPKGGDAIMAKKAPMPKAPKQPNPIKKKGGY